MRAPLTTLFLSLSLVVAGEAVAQTKRRAVASPSTVKVNLTGEVRDAVTNEPVPQVEVSVSGDLVRTNRNGEFTIGVPQGRPVTVTFARAGYTTSTSQLNLAAATTTTIRLTPKPTVRVLTIQNQTFELDEDTIEFGYAEPFVGVRRARSMKVCRSGSNEEVEIDRDELKRILGPATNSPGAGCCANALGIDVEKATGGSERVFFKVSCLGLAMLIQGHDHKTFEQMAIRFADVREVIFP